MNGKVLNFDADSEATLRSNQIRAQTDGIKAQAELHRANADLFKAQAEGTRAATARADIDQGGTQDQKRDLVTARSAYPDGFVYLYINDRNELKWSRDGETHNTVVLNHYESYQAGPEGQVVLVPKGITKGHKAEVIDLKFFEASDLLQSSMLQISILAADL